MVYGTMAVVAPAMNNLQSTLKPLPAGPEFKYRTVVV